MSLPKNIKSRKDFRQKRSLFDSLFKKKKNLSLKRLNYSQRHRQQKLRLIINYLVSLGIVCLLFGFLISLVVFAWTSKNLPDPNKLLERNIEQTTTIYDRAGENILYQLHGDVNRRIIQLSDLPEYVKWATITAEDRNFYEHSGFSIKGMIRSFLTNTFTGTKVGGSTITQQFVKNAILTSQKTYIRKIKEVVLAWQIETRFSKDQILKLY